MNYNQKIINNLTFDLLNDSYGKVEAFNCCGAFTCCNVGCVEKICLGGTVFSNLNNNTYLNSTILHSHNYMTFILLKDSPSLKKNVVKATNIVGGFNTKTLEDRINFNISRLYLGFYNSGNKTSDELDMFVFLHTTPINYYMDKTIFTGINKSDSSIKVYYICKSHISFSDFIINLDSGDLNGKSINHYNFTNRSAYAYSKKSFKYKLIGF